jgi:hypothetical protein
MSSVKPKIFALLLLTFSFLALVFVRTSSKIQEPIRYPTKDRLQWYATKTKNEGKRKVIVPGPIVDYPGIDMNFNEAVKNYTVLIAEPIESKSYFDSDDIITWYKFRILDILSPRNYVYCNTCPPIPEAPREMSPINPDEFVLAVSGGTATVDGVDITMTNNSLPSFEIGKEYLLFVSVTPSGVAMLGAGPSGIFAIGNDGSLEAVDKNNRPLKAEINQRFKLKLSVLKSSLNN